MPKPAQTRASVSIATALTVPRVLDLADKSSINADDAVSRVRFESRDLHSATFSVREHLESTEYMRFRVIVDRALGRTTARTVIDTFTVKEGGVSALVPMTRRKILGFGAYESFMDWFVSAVLAEDSAAIVTLVSGQE